VYTTAAAAEVQVLPDKLDHLVKAATEVREDLVKLQEQP
jgi:hypothetical protein